MMGGSSGACAGRPGAAVSLPSCPARLHFVCFTFRVQVKEGDRVIYFKYAGEWADRRSGQRERIIGVGELASQHTLAAALGAPSRALGGGPTHRCALLQSTC